MRRPFPLSIGLILACVAAPANAAEFTPGWDLDGVWSSNVFRTPDEDQVGEKIPKEDDFSLRTGPTLKLRDPQGDLTYDMKYQLIYEEFARLNGISEFEHFVNGSGSWNIDDRTSISASDDFADAASLGALFDAVGVEAADVIVRADRQRVKTNHATTSIRRSLGPLWELTVAGDHSLYEYDVESATDSSAFSGTVQLTRGITPRLVAGIGGSGQRQDFQDNVGGDDSGTTFLQAFAIANYTLSRTARISFSGGPAYSMPDEIDPQGVEIRRLQPFNIATCPVQDGTPFIPLGQAQGFLVGGDRCSALVVAGPVIGQPAGTFFVPLGNSENISIANVGESGVENSLTYFARIQIEKDWQLWRARLSYSRSASSGSGLGTSTIVDTFLGQLRWTPTRKWSFNLQGSMSIQSAVSEFNQQLVAVRPVSRTIRLQNIVNGQTVNGTVVVPEPFELFSGEKIDNPIDIRTYRVELRGSRRITRNLNAEASMSWYQQTSSSDFIDSTRSEYRALLGFTWNFDPIPL
jgi:hypothetical protein